MNTLGIVQVLPATDRTPWKVGRKLGGMSLVELLARRVADCQRLDGVIVLAEKRHEQAIRALVPPDVTVFASDAPDPLARAVAAVDAYRASGIVRLCANHPFIDPDMVDQLVGTAEAHPHCDYISYRAADGRPAIASPLGVFAEWCRGDALRRAHREARFANDRELVTAYVYSHPERFQLRLIPLPPELDRHDLRMKIDVEEDWDHAQVICEALGAEQCDWRQIAGLLDHQPALRHRMAILNRARA